MMAVFMSWNWSPIKRVFDDLLGLIVELNKMYTYDRHANGDVLH
jgi:hypothetical protein